jgi:hypothetical protein
MPMSRKKSKPPAPKVGVSQVPPHPRPQDPQHGEWLIDEGSDESFPASDPSSITQPHLIEKPRAKRASEPVVLTVGHSTRPLGEFIELLKAHSVARLVDVRTVPRSRHNPQFNRDTFPAALRLAGIGYTHAAGLGGLRRARPDSPNQGWRNVSFRGYADYMQTVEFARSLEELVDLAERERVALMCAEAVPWRCHRSLIADALTVRGIHVQEIIGDADCRAHALTAFAKVDGTTITYPAESA